jgi:hypothetical protein
MDAIRAGRMWVCHGDLISGLDFRLRSPGWGHDAPMGGRITVRRGSPVRVSAEIALNEAANYAQLRPELARVDLIMGEVTGPVADRDTMTAPGTRVIKSWDVTRTTGPLTLSHTVKIDGPCYFRLRGTDGKRNAAGPFGAHVDPAGPVMDVPGNANPWEDLWFYANPIFVDVR